MYDAYTVLEVRMNTLFDRKRIWLLIDLEKEKNETNDGTNADYLSFG